MEKDIRFYSAFIFIFPVIWAIKRKQNKFALLFGCLLLTSICYHGDYFLPYSKYVDICVAHFITITLTLYGTYMVIKGNDRYILPTLIGYFIILSYKGFILTKLLHSIILHCLGAIALILFTLCLR
jgi:hypothetical protein